MLGVSRSPVSASIEEVWIWCWTIPKNSPKVRKVLLQGAVATKERGMRLQVSRVQARPQDSLVRSAGGGGHSGAVWDQMVTELRPGDSWKQN
jgi:hypothetical protein